MTGVIHQCVEFKSLHQNVNVNSSTYEITFHFCLYNQGCVGVASCRYKATHIRLINQISIECSTWATTQILRTHALILSQTHV